MKKKRCSGAPQRTSSAYLPTRTMTIIKRSFAIYTSLSIACSLPTNLNLPEKICASARLGGSIKILNPGYPCHLRVQGILGNVTAVAEVPEEASITLYASTAMKTFGLLAVLAGFLGVDAFVPAPSASLALRQSRASSCASTPAVKRQSRVQQQYMVAAPAAEGTVTSVPHGGKLIDLNLKTDEEKKVRFGRVVCEFRLLCVFTGVGFDHVPQSCGCCCAFLTHTQQPAFSRSTNQQVVINGTWLVLSATLVRLGSRCPTAVVVDTATAHYMAPRAVLEPLSCVLASGN